MTQYSSPQHDCDTNSHEGLIYDEIKCEWLQPEGPRKLGSCYAEQRLAWAKAFGSKRERSTVGFIASIIGAVIEWLWHLDKLWILRATDGTNSDKGMGYGWPKGKISDGYALILLSPILIAYWTILSAFWFGVVALLIASIILSVICAAVPIILLCPIWLVAAVWGLVFELPAAWLNKELE